MACGGNQHVNASPKKRATLISYLRNVFVTRRTPKLFLTFSRICYTTARKITVFNIQRTEDGCNYLIRDFPNQFIYSVYF